MGHGLRALGCGPRAVGRGLRLEGRGPWARLAQPLGSLPHEAQPRGGRRRSLSPFLLGLNLSFYNAD